MSKLSPQDLIDRLQWRYATKKFDASKIIPDEVWSGIASSLVLTPSSFGLQPWHFVTIRDQQNQRRAPPPFLGTSTSY
jgi:nitroreductase